MSYISVINVYDHLEKRFNEQHDSNHQYINPSAGRVSLPHLPFRTEDVRRNVVYRHYKFSTG